MKEDRMGKRKKGNTEKTHGKEGKNENFENRKYKYFPYFLFPNLSRPVTNENKLFHAAQKYCEQKVSQSNMFYLKILTVFIRLSLEDNTILFHITSYLFISYGFSCTITSFTSSLVEKLFIPRLQCLLFCGIAVGEQIQ